MYSYLGAPTAGSTLQAAMSKAASSVATRAISRVTIRSQITPDYDFDPSVSSKPQPKSGIGNAIMGLIRPAVYVETPAGTIRAEPWGPPKSNYLPAIVVAGGVVVLAFFGASYLLGRRSAR